VRCAPTGYTPIRYALMRCHPMPAHKMYAYEMHMLRALLDSLSQGVLPRGDQTIQPSVKEYGHVTLRIASVARV
jgi:hypothetical protein